MHILKCPEWVKEFDYINGKVEVPESVYESINKDLNKLSTQNPLVSVVIPAWNEEKNILVCIASLAKSRSTVPFEIIVVNNNSTDRTGEILEKLNVKTYLQTIPGTGAARQLGQENATGDFILTADADCIYPSTWVQVMYESLTEKGVVCVYGRYSFIEDETTPRWQLYIYEKLKNIVAEIRHIKRPYLNSYTMSMGYIKKLGLIEKYDMRGVRGEDGRMTFDLMKYGKIKQVKSRKAVIWTGQRTLKQDGSLFNSLKARCIKEVSRAFSYFSAHKPHDTKTSEN